MNLGCCRPHREEEEIAFTLAENVLAGEVPEPKTLTAGRVLAEARLQDSTELSLRDIMLQLRMETTGGSWQPLDVETQLLRRAQKSLLPPGLQTFFI